MSANPWPSLDEFGYQPLRFLETDSTMSTILLTSDRQNRLLILKVAKVDQHLRADLNRQAIHNTVEWCTKLGPNPGIADLYPISSNQNPSPTYLARLHTWEGTPEFLAMEYLAGGSLHEMVGEQRLTLKLALQIACGVARSLTFIHKHGCVHRDLKPGNILFRTPLIPDAPTQAIANPPLPILIDFGVAARQGESRFVSGSRLWMAPELQVAYERYPLPVDPAWDVYALGLIVCYMISGVMPRRRSYDFASYEIYRQRALGVLESEMANCTATEAKAGLQLQHLLEKTLAKEPAERPTASELAKELAEILVQLGASLPQAKPPWSRLIPIKDPANVLLLAKPQLKIGAIVALLILVFAILWAILPVQNRKPESTQPVHANDLAPVPTLLISSTTLPMPPTLIKLPSNNPAPTLIPWNVTVIEPSSTLLPRAQ